MSIMRDEEMGDREGLSDSVRRMDVRQEDLQERYARLLGYAASDVYKKLKGGELFTPVGSSAVYITSKPMTPTPMTPVTFKECWHQIQPGEVDVYFR